MSQAFSTVRRGEIAELHALLIHTKIEKRKAGMKKTIAAMTQGKDVSSLFAEVLKCVETHDLILKKLVYLYTINYATTQPNIAIMAVNTFRKDSRQKDNPLLRALAVRTMGCIGVKNITEYLCDPLKDALMDEDAYVRKTSVLCVAKLFEINKQIIDDFNFFNKLLEIVSNDGNPMVVANALIAISEISQTRGLSFKTTNEILKKLMVALQDANEWSRIYILDFLALNPPQSTEDISESLKRIVPQLSHSNAGVVMSAMKVLIRFMDSLTEPEEIRSITRKLTPAMISLLSSESEIQYIALKNINLMLQKRHFQLDKEIKIFFCNYKDPLYVKIEKLEILVRIADNKNIDYILLELKEYSQELDVKFVRKSVQSIGRCAIKLEQSSDKCVQVLFDLIKTEIAYIVQEALIVIKDIMRKYPNRYESIIKDIYKCLKNLDDNRAREAMVWIIGEYNNRIENSFDLLSSFLASFREEEPNVQMQILNAIVKHYLNFQDNDELITKVLQIATEEMDNPDLRDRAFIYWRLVFADIELAKQIVLSEKPPIAEDSGIVEPELLEKLIQNMSLVASIYYKAPESFVPKIRAKINERFDQEYVEGSEITKDKDYVDSSGQVIEEGKIQAKIKPELDVLSQVIEAENEDNPKISKKNIEKEVNQIKENLLDI